MKHNSGDLVNIGNLKVSLVVSPSYFFKFCLVGGLKTTAHKYIFGITNNKPMKQHDCEAMYLKK